jgi:hypothetical protein
MRITHIRNRQDQWLFKYATAAEHDEVKSFVSMLRDKFHAEFKEVSDHSVEVRPVVE